MSKDWREGYRRALFAYVARVGRAVEPRRGWRTYGGWEDYGATDHIRRHLKDCPIDPDKSELREGHWEEFDGTFAEPPWSQQHGVDVVGECTCGLLDDIHLRVESSVTDILNALLRE